MPDIHDFRFVTNQQKRQIGGTIMEERKYTFYDRYQKVKYANITAEELEVLNICNKIIYVFLTIFLYLLKCPQSLIL